MADLQLTEEELQQSVRLSEEGPEVEDDEPDPEEAVTDGANEVGVSVAGDGDQEVLEEESVVEDGSYKGDAESDKDVEDVEDAEDAEDVEDVYEEEDSAGSEGDDRPPGSPAEEFPAENHEAVANAEDDEDEGVGAVKIRPGETDDEESEGSASLRLGGESGEESEGDAEWEEEAVEDHGVADEDDESEAANNNVCMFCKQDEEHDPGEEFESYLTCSGCSENSHQHCAREAGALVSQQASASWRCPECSSVAVARQADTMSDADIDDLADGDGAPTTRRTVAPRLAHDLLPSQKGPADPESHSMFNQLVLDEDPLDGSRILRKRKASSVEADESVMSLRKRRRSTADAPSIEDANSTTTSSRPHSGRSLRLKLAPQPLATIQKKSRTSLVTKLRVNSSALRQIVSRKPRGQRKRGGRGGPRGPRPGTSRSTATAASSIAAPQIGASFSQPFYSFYDRETDELKGRPYGGILAEAEADTSKTLPTNDDRRRFDEAKQKAEEEWRQRLLAMQAEAAAAPGKKPKKSSGPASQIECIEFGGWEIDTWYAAPYPEEYSRNRVLYICEFCLKYMNSDYVAWRHKLKCPAKHPPGDEIYRHESVSVFEVDGRKNPVYCQNLCLLAKLFLGSKTLYYDVEPFLFYVLCEFDDLGYHFVGYFSKEKRASSQNNVSCILTLPIHQRKGYGNLLIDFSYLLTRAEQKTGSPEKPLSDMGLVSYRNYWRLILCRYLLDNVSTDKSEKRGLGIKKIADDTGMTPDDVISALEGLRCLVRDPQTKLYAFRVDLDYCRDYVAKWEAKNYVQLKPGALTWTPYVMGRSNATNFELGPALNAIAPREEEDTTRAATAATTTASEVLTNGDGNAVRLAPDRTDENQKTRITSPVLESTEPNESGQNSDEHPPPEDDKPDDVATNGTQQEITDPQPPETAGGGTDSEESWVAAYKDIAPIRFEVFPPISGRRTDRTRSALGRPVPGRVGGSASRPKARRSLGSRRSTSSAPKSTPRRTGGTGRGPGRWPKGTKKSDYGNADSGPGLPPAWVAERNRLAALVVDKTTGGKIEEVNGETGDTVQVQTPTAKEPEEEGVKTTPRKGGSPSGSSGKKRRPSPRSQQTIGENGNDVEMEDVDA